MTTSRTYARAIDGPWLLYDNERDPYQLNNLCGRPEHADLQAEMGGRLSRLLAAQHNEFLPGEAYLEKWGYDVDPHTGYSTAITGDRAPG